MAAAKARSVSLVAAGLTLAMSLWFVSAAILPGMAAEAALTPGRAAALSSAVQLGFVIGALALAVHGAADRFDPRRVFAICALIAAAANLALLAFPTGGAVQIGLRAVTGAALAGVYPVGMKIAVGWGARDRGLLVGLIVAAVTLGSASPHLIALAGGADWRTTVITTSALATLGGALALAAGLGPGHARAARFDAGALRLAWTNRRVRLAYAGYFGHMWELYAFWAWIGVAASVALADGTASTALAGGAGSASLADGTASAVTADASGRGSDAARLLTFVAIALGGLACAPAGWLADRIGKARVARGAMVLSGVAGVATAAAFHGPVWLFVGLVLIWGAAVIPDSAQFSALVADAAPPQSAGSLMTLQTALGFLLTFFTVQAVPMAAAALGWPATLALMAIGPAAGVEAMRRLIRLG